MTEHRNIERISAAEAMARARGNGLRRYPSPERDGERLYPLAAPTVAPGFAIAPTDTVYAIGSCFARNVEKALAEAGLRVLSREFDLGEIGESLAEGANFFNKYSIHSVLNEVRWALDRQSFPGADLLYRIGPDRYVDAQLGMGRLDFDIETILAFRHRYLDALAAVATADVVVLTLGYVETWFDRQLGLYLNTAPPAQAIKAEPERFEFRVLSYQDVLDGLNALHAVLQEHRVKPLKMLVTVSPVPLLSTFRDMDVLVANTYSKSVQRAALDEFLIGKEGVDYFPSYEFVTLSNPAIAWGRNDYRHVSQDAINRIMDNVLSRYLGAAAVPSPGALLATLRMLLTLDQYEEVLAKASESRAQVDSDAGMLLIEAMAARRLNRPEHAWEVLTRARALAPDRHDVLERLIHLCRPLRRKGEAKVLVAEHAALFPDRAAFREKVTWT